MTRKHSASSKSGQKARGARPPSQRSLRVAEEIRHALSDILAQHHLSDPDLAGKTVTVTGVKISPDLRNAEIFVLPLGGEGGDVLVKALNRAQGYFRGELARAVKLRLSPLLRFHRDESFAEARRIEELLLDPVVRRDLKKGG
jgi:ribosome-binding factor A